MRIVVISDTHMPKMAKSLPKVLVRELKQADVILHAGDWTQLSVYEELARYAAVHGVAGNNDGPEIVKQLGSRKVLDFGSCRIGLVHGHIGGVRMSTEEKAIQAFSGEEVNVIVFGHSHIPVQKHLNGILLFNPGSPTDKRRQPQYSFGLIDIGMEGGDVQARHIFYENKN